LRDRESADAVTQPAAAKDADAPPTAKTRSHAAIKASREPQVVEHCRLDRLVRDAALLYRREHLSREGGATPISRATRAPARSESLIQIEGALRTKPRTAPLAFRFEISWSQRSPSSGRRS